VIKNMITTMAVISRKPFSCFNLLLIVPSV
jgi:hypothetical protein